MDDNSEDKLQKRKKSRFFETYISKVLKTIASNGITANAKQQLNSAICIIAKTLCKTTTELTCVAGKKTVSVKEIHHAMSILFPCVLCEMCSNEAEQSVEKFTDTTLKYSSRQNKACITFPPSICEKFLRSSKLMVTKTSPVFMACVLECLTRLILTYAVGNTENAEHQRITIRDLELGVRTHKDVSALFLTCNLTFVGGGVLPVIHDSLLPRASRKRRKVEDDAEKKTHRFRPGTVCLREIKKYQKSSNCLTLPKFPFERVVRNTINNSVKISKGVFIILQYYIEQFMVDFLRDANSATVHSGRVKLTKADINFISSLRKYK